MKFEIEDAPLVLDGMLFLICVLVAETMSMKDINTLKSILKERFIGQGFDIEQSAKISGMIFQAITAGKEADKQNEL